MMELRGKLQVSSTWECSDHLKSVFYLSSQSGIVLDQPMPLEQCGHVVLSERAAGEEEGCFVRLSQLSSLSGYRVVGVELHSAARTMELYSGWDDGDYIATSRGTMLDDTEDGGKQYQCQVTLPMEGYSVCDRLTLKLLSLRGKKTVPVSRLTLVVTEDYGGQCGDSGGEVQTSNSKQALQADLGELVSSLTTGAPPLIQSLLSSLQHHCASTAQRSNTAPTSSTQHSAGKEGVPKRSNTAPTEHSADMEGVPAEISQMMAAFRQLRPKRPTPPPPDREIESESHRDKTKKEEKNSSEISLSSIEALVDGKIAELEARMRAYVDAKVKTIMSRIETNLEQIGTNLVSSENRMVTSGREDEDEVDSHNRTQNGVLHFEDQLD